MNYKIINFQTNIMQTSQDITWKHRSPSCKYILTHKIILHTFLTYINILMVVSLLLSDKTYCIRYLFPTGINFLCCIITFFSSISKPTIIGVRYILVKLQLLIKCDFLFYFRTYITRTMLNSINLKSMKQLLYHYQF